MEELFQSPLNSPSDLISACVSKGQEPTIMTPKKDSVEISLPEHASIISSVGSSLEISSHVISHTTSSEVKYSFSSPQQLKTPIKESVSTTPYVFSPPFTRSAAKR